jgi:hypothetical protein
MTMDKIPDPVTPPRRGSDYVNANGEPAQC